jgi:hypothetical protein
MAHESVDELQPSGLQVGSTTPPANGEHDADNQQHSDTGSDTDQDNISQH